MPVKVHFTDDGPFAECDTAQEAADLSKLVAAGAGTEATPVCPRCGGLMFDGSKTCRRCYETPAPSTASAGLTVSEAITLCAHDPIGQRRILNLAGRTPVVAQNLRTSLNLRVNTRAWKWSVQVISPNVLAATKVSLREPEPAESQTPAPIELASREEIEQSAVLENAPKAAPLQQPDWTVPPPAGSPWVAGRTALAEVDSRIAKLIEMRGALLRVIPMMETGSVL